MLLRHAGFARLWRARELLLAEPEVPLPIEAIAREAGLSPSHFTRQFEAVFGRTPHQFRIDARLDRARLLLAGGAHSVTEVCFEVGFSSLGSFSDLFRRRIGEPPSAFQRRARPMIAVPAHQPGSLVPGCLSLMAHLPADAFRSFREARPGAGTPD
jgi:AraC-like DNA-binding protein